MLGINFCGAVRGSSKAVAFIGIYHFDAYGPHTGLFSYGFPRKLRAGPYGSYDNTICFSAGDFPY